MLSAIQQNPSCLQSILTIARMAGVEILKVYEQDFQVEYKQDNSPLTKADQLAHQIIASGLEKLFPAIPILSEESSQIPYDARKNWEYFWLVDPLDGTKEFIHRNGEFTVNIALIHQGRAVTGIVYVPVKDILYYAVQGTGSFKIESTKPPVKLQAKPLPKQGAITIVGSRSHGSEAMEAFLSEQKQRYAEVNFIPAGSALKFCLVAEGKADVYPRLAPTMEWDTAAAHIIAKESGKSVVNFENGQELIYNKENLLNPWFICQ